MDELKSLPPALRASTFERIAVVQRVAVGVAALTEILHWVEVAMGIEWRTWAGCAERLLILWITLHMRRLVMDKGRRPHERLFLARLWLGLLAILSCCAEWGTTVHVGGVSRVCLLVSLAPMLIPDSLRRSLAYCAVLLLSLPIGYALACLRYPEVPELGAALLHLLNNLLAASGAWVGAATLHQLREAIAEQYGGYRLVRRLGEGAFGEVWEARHKFLERPAAIKLMRPSAHDPTMVERFYREASILSQLESPHTVRLYDYGSTEEGKLYLAMELLRGETLSEVVRTRGPLPEPVVLSILAQACHSLLEAHEKGLVHRDIKPDNLFLCAFGLEKDFLKVLDFGLAKQVTDSVALTRASEVVGTPDFMSPEQIQGQPLDGRSDLYSLGCLGCFLLSGQKPFPGENPARVLAGHLYLEPSWPTASPQLLAVLRRCMEKDREHRFASAAALLGAIQA